MTGITRQGIVVPGPGMPPRPQPLWIVPTTPEPEPQSIPTGATEPLGFKLFPSFQPGYRLIDGSDLITLVNTMYAAQGGSILDFGGVGDGVTDNTQALLLALATTNRITFPAGTFYFASTVHFTMPATPAGVPGTGLAIVGAGSDVTFIKCAEDCWNFTMPSPYNSITMGGMTFLSQVPGGNAAALQFRMTGTYPGGSPIMPNSYLFDLSFYGSDGYLGNNYWSNAIYTLNVSNFNFDTINVYGPGAGNAGNGINFNGTASTNIYGVIYNFVNCNFTSLAAGLVYGTYIQGVQVVNCNFLGSIGIYLPSTSLNTDQLCIVNSQFGQYGHGLDIGIDILGPSLSVAVSNCVFTLYSSTSLGINLQSVDSPTIVGNSFNMSVAGSQGINLVNATQPSPLKGGLVVGNSFYGPGTGIITNNSVANVFGSNFFDPNLTAAIQGAADGLVLTNVSVVESGKAVIVPVTAGAANSGGAGFRTLLIPN